VKAQQIVPSRGPRKRYAPGKTGGRKRSKGGEGVGYAQIRRAEQKGSRNRLKGEVGFQNWVTGQRGGRRAIL